MFESFNDFENKSMPLNEGMFSFKTLGDNKAISAMTGADIYMFDNKGNMWHEENYEGYGIFGSEDYFELMAKMNGESGRDAGIDLYFGEDRKTLYPVLTRDADFNWKKHKFTTKIKSDPKQGAFRESVVTEANQLKKGDTVKFKDGSSIYIVGPKGDGYDYKDGREKGHHPKEWFDMMISSGKAIVESVVNEAKSIAKIQKEWSNVTAMMKDTVADWKQAEGQEKEDLLDQLKVLTVSKKKLEAELDAAVGLKDMDVELDEATMKDINHMLNENEQIDEAIKVGDLKVGRGFKLGDDVFRIIKLEKDKRFGLVADTERIDSVTGARYRYSDTAKELVDFFNEEGVVAEGMVLEAFDSIDEELNERVVTIKRRYTENYPAVTVGKAARVRNRMLEAIADGKLTQEEFDAILKEMSIDAKRWSRRNARYFNVSEDGVSLSKAGSKILKKIAINENTVNEARQSWIVYTGVVAKKFYSEHTNKKSAEKMIDMIIKKFDTVGMMTKELWEKERAEGFVIEETTPFVYESFTAFESTNLNEASFVVWYEDKEGKHLLGTFHNKKAADKYKSEEEDEVLNTVGVESIGTMSKTMWDKKEAPYIKEAVISEDFKDVSDKFKNALDELPDSKFNTKDIEALIKKHKEKRPDSAMAYAKKAFGWLFKESVLTEGKHDEMLDKVADAVKDASNFMNIGIALKKAGIKYDFSTGMMPMYQLKQHPIAILNKKYVEKGDREVGDVAIGVLESVNTDNDEMLTEAFQSSKLRNLLTMGGADGRTLKGLSKAFYGLTKYKLDELPDASLRDMDTATAYKNYRTDNEYVVFYIVDNEKDNPFTGDRDWVGKIKPGIIAITRGKEFLGDNKRFDADRKLSDKAQPAGGDKRYSGWGASGIYNIKRAAEVADRAIVVWLNNDAFKSNDLTKERTEAKSGAIAFKSDADFKKANLARYREILATKASKLPLDKMVESAINELSDQIKKGLSAGEVGRYGDILIGKNKKGSEVKMRDASNHMSNILDNYGRYCSYVNEAEKEKDSGYSSGFYEKESKKYAKEVSDQIKKIKGMDYAW